MTSGKRNKRGHGAEQCHAKCLLINECERKCWSKIRDPLHAVADDGVKAVVENRDRKTYCKIIFDKCIEARGPRADFVLHCGRDVQILELKASDIEKAFLQIIGTAAFLRKRISVNFRVSGTIVGRRCPKFDGVVRKKMEVATTKHNIRLKIETSSNSVPLSNYGHDS